MVRIVDVARAAGVSTATVSRVLNGKTVRDEMAVAVREAVARLGYEPDRAARSLRMRRSEVVALVLPDIENPFFTALARGVEDITQAVGYSLVLCNTDEDPEKEARYLSVARRERMAGVIVAPAGPRPALDLMRDHGHVVVVDREVADDVHQVVFDNIALGGAATRVLLEHGHRRIACVTGPLVTRTAHQRALGWSGAMLDAGLADDHLVHTTFRVDGGRTAMRELLSLPDPPDAVLATNNLVGVGILRARSAARRPDVGVAVIGELPFVTGDVDNLWLLPLEPRRMGLEAARRLIDAIAGRAEPASVYVQESVPRVYEGRAGTDSRFDSLPRDQYAAERYLLPHP